MKKSKTSSKKEIIPKTTKEYDFEVEIRNICEKALKNNIPLATIIGVLNTTSIIITNKWVIIMENQNQNKENMRYFS